MADVIDGTHHRVVDGIGIHVTHESAVNFEIVDRQLLEVGKRGEAAAEIIEGKAAAAFLEPRDELRGTNHIGDGGGFGDLEADLGGGHASATKRAEDEFQHVGVADGFARQIDTDLADCGQRARARRQPAEDIVYHPAVDAAREVITLGGWQEFARQNHTAVLVAHAQQDLVVRAALLGTQRRDALAIQFKTVVVHRLVDARCPAHFAMAQLHRPTVGLVGVHAIATGILGRIAGHVGQTQHVARRVAGVGHRHDADADRHRIAAPLPVEDMLLDHAAQILGGVLGQQHRAVLQQDREFVAADACNDVALARGVPDQVRDLAQQFVAGGRAATVIDELELIDVEDRERVFGVFAVRAGDDLLQAQFQGLAIGEVGEFVVTVLKGQQFT